MKNSIKGNTGGNSIICKFSDQNEVYGIHVVDKILKKLKNLKVDKIVDLGAGECRDLGIAHKYFKKSKKYGIDIPEHYIRESKPNFVNILGVNIENSKLPFENESIDIFMANQFLEHTKELFWIMHEVSRSLKIGGHMLIGVPNIASFHNRILMLFGVHPTQYKSYSAHVRPFSKNDFLNFLNVCFSGGYSLEYFGGSQFYPFPPLLSRFFCNILPNMSFSIFFLIKKIKKYDRQFLDHIDSAKLETPFFKG